MTTKAYGAAVENCWWIRVTELFVEEGLCFPPSEWLFFSGVEKKETEKKEKQERVAQNSEGKELPQVRRKGFLQNFFASAELAL